MTVYLNGVPVDVPATLTVSETEVFDGIPPVAWTDLNLSSVVGANVALVILKVQHGFGTSKAMAFRKNGDTDEHYSTAAVELGSGAALVDSSNAYHQIVVVVTDSGGIIEWKTEEATDNTTVDVIAYVK